MAEHRRARLAAIATFAVVLIVVVMAFALGGNHSATESGGSEVGAATGPQSGGSAPFHGSVDRVPVAAPTPVASAAAGLAATTASSGSTKGSSGGSSNGFAAEFAADTVTATRVVKTGTLELGVKRDQVGPTITSLVRLTTSLGGYVSQSRTDNVLGSPTGEVTVRIPAAHFDSAVTSAEKLGHVTSLTTNAHDVTGKYVDLSARLGALQRTRTTYLTILGRATTIGSTLEVQQRVDDVQQQIEQLQGELKLLRNQSSDGTLTVDVSQLGAVTAVTHHHPHHGIGAAWHRSIDRFARGFDAIVGALGPLLLAILVLAVLAGIGALGYRGVRRATGQTT